MIGSHPSEGFDCFWINAQPSPVLRGFTKEIATVNGSQMDPEKAANARLIASSPDLLEPAPDAADILEQYAEFIRTSVNADDLERHPYVPLIEETATRLRAAIARARGEV